MKISRNHTILLKNSLYWILGLITFLIVGIPSLSMISPEMSKFKDIIIPCVATLFPPVCGMYGFSQWRAKNENIANGEKLNKEDVGK